MDWDDAVCMYVLGKIAPQNLVVAAADALDVGLDSPHLRQLAGTLGNDREIVDKFFLSAMNELGMSVPSPKNAALREARSVARRILAGQISAYDGARYIWHEIYTKFPSLQELVAFVGAASEYEDDESNRPYYAWKILEECHKLIEQSV